MLMNLLQWMIADLFGLELKKSGRLVLHYCSGGTVQPIFVDVLASRSGYSGRKPSVPMILRDVSG